ncbi:MAG: hypothetical protein LBL59_03350 [Xanthomonadaceae bacterium]|jgi:hypothetical protein|nr:hypothetical protein [Xanthomonadaceae bacterium]
MIKTANLQSDGLEMSKAATIKTANSALQVGGLKESQTEQGFEGDSMIKAANPQSGGLEEYPIHSVDRFLDASGQEWEVFEC